MKRLSMELGNMTLRAFEDNGRFWYDVDVVALAIDMPEQWVFEFIYKHGLDSRLITYYGYGYETMDSDGLAMLISLLPRTSAL